MALDLSKLEKRTERLYRLLSVLDYYCKHGGLDECIEVIVPLIDILLDDADKIYGDIANANELHASLNKM